MCTEASNILRAVAGISLLAIGISRSLRITVFGMYQGASSIMHKVDWKRFRISMLEVEAVLQSYNP
jgi:hypothetical protein